MNHEGKIRKDGRAQGEGEPYDASVQYDIEHTQAYRFFAQPLNKPPKFREAKPGNRENRKAIFHHDILGNLRFCGYERPKTPIDCEYLRFDQWHYPICMHNLEFPGDCAPDNCPLKETVL